MAPYDMTRTRYDANRPPPGFDSWVSFTTHQALAFLKGWNAATLGVASIIQPIDKVVEGRIIRATSIVWNAIATQLSTNWKIAFEIPPEKWEEIIAGAFDKAGFEQVILTPRSGDFGRDVVAIKNGVGCIKIIGSVKAYGPGHLVKHDDVRSLIGVMHGEPDTSKGLLVTTSDFAPRIASDPFIKPFMPYRLELMNGEKLQRWLAELAQRDKKALKDAHTSAIRQFRLQVRDLRQSSELLK